MGLIEAQVENMKNLLANCVKFQEFVGAADATEAKEEIYTDPIFLTKDIVQKDLYAVIVDKELEGELTKTGLGSGAYTINASTFVLIVGTYDEWSQENSVAFRTAVDEIFDEILMLRGTPGYKEINTFRRLTEHPWLWKTSTQDDSDKFSDLKRGFQFAFEEGVFLG